MSSATINSSTSASQSNNKSFEKIPQSADPLIENKSKDTQVRQSNDNLTKSTALELRLTEEIHILKKQMNQKENEFKKDRAVLEQNIDLLKLQIQEYKKREENLKKMNETIMNSLNDIANQGNNSKIFKEIQLNYEQHNKELVESRTKLQLNINNLENENRVLKDQLNEMKLQMKDLEIAVEKEKMNNERALEANYLDRTQMENDLQKQHLITEEVFSKEKLALEAKYQELNHNKDQQILEQREKYEEKIRQLQANFEKEKSALEQRIQKNLNTIRKYQTHIEQNASMNQSTILANQSKMDISCIKTESDIELRSEILKINNEKAKLNLDLQHQIQQTYQKDEQIIKLQQKINDQNKQLEELKQKLSFYEANGDCSSRTFVSNNNFQVQRDVQSTPQVEKLQQSPIQINRSASSINRNQRSMSNNLQAQNNQNIPLQTQNKVLRDSMKQSFIKQRISNNNYNNTMLDCIDDSKTTNVYQSQIQQNGLTEIQQQEYDNSLENIALQSYPQTQTNQMFSNSQFQQQLPNNVYLQLQQQFLMSQDGSILQDTQQQQQLYALQQSSNNIFNQSQMMNNYVQPFQHSVENNNVSEPLANTSQLNNQFVNQLIVQPMEGQIFTPNQDKYVNFNNNQQEIEAFSQKFIPQNNNQEFNDTQNESRKKTKKSLHDQENRNQSPIVNGYYNNQNNKNSQINRNQSTSPMMMNDVTAEMLQQDRSLQNITNQSQFLQRNASNNNLNNNYKTLLLCENCGQCFMPNDLVDHMAQCNTQIQQHLNMTQQQLNMTQHQQSVILDKTQLLQQQQQQSDEQSENFYKIINSLNYEKQLVEQKLLILENHLKNSENANGIVAQDRDRLKQELDNIMLELGKAKMNQVVQSEEQVACTVALKNEIKFLINKLLKAKGKLSENNTTTNLNQTQNMENISYFNDQFNQSQSQFNQKQNLNRKDYSSFSIKGCVDFNTYQNNINQSQCLIDSTCLRESNLMNPNINKSINFDQNQFYAQNQGKQVGIQQNMNHVKKSQYLNQRSINNISNISQNSYF
ncbi:hypothetical protein ABPG72_000014 [Tetrahymena utriculariae]